MPENIADNIYGITPAGFNRPRLPEIQAELKKSIETALGKPISIAPNSITGILISIVADRLCTLWEELETAYNSMYPMSAEGNALNKAVSFGNVLRLNATRTTTAATCYGLHNTIIPSNSRVRCVYDGEQYINQDQGVISLNKCVHVRLSVVPQANSLYTIAINGSNYSYTSSATPTEVEILNGLKAALSSLVGWNAIVKDAVLVITKTEQETAVSVAVSSNIGVIEVGSPILFRCLEYGKVEPPLNTITDIVTPIAGWQSVNNTMPADVGREQETDEEIRERYEIRLYAQGWTQCEAIRARIMSTVKNIKKCIVYENTLDVFDMEGRPPHCIEAVVDGGDERPIAEAIYTSKAGGIDSFGDILVDIMDSQKVAHPIYFNRPKPLKVWFKVTLKAKTGSSLGGDATKLTQDAIMTYGAKFNIHDEVILQTFACPIFAVVTNLGNIEILACVKDTTPNPTDYTLNNITVGSREMATFDINRIMVVIT